MNTTLLAVTGTFSELSLLLMDSAVKGAGLLALAAVAAAMLRRNSAAMRHRIWLLALLATLVVPALSALLRPWRALPQWTDILPKVAAKASLPSIAGAAEHAIEMRPVTAAAVGEPPTAVARDSAAVAEVAVLRPSSAAAEAAAKPSAANWNWINALLYGWAIGFCVLILRLIAAQWMLCSIERRATIVGSSTRPANVADDPLIAVLEAACGQLGLGRPITLLMRPEKTIPITWGIFRHRLLLPAAAQQWSREQLRSVLLHELAHVRRRDMIAQLLAQVACAVYWFNPLAWFAARRLGVEGERACDDLALTNGVRPSAYVGHLLLVIGGLSPSRGTQPCGLAMARKSSLEGRLLAALNEKLNRRGISVSLAAITLTAAVSIVVPVAMLRAAQDRPAVRSIATGTTTLLAAPDKPVAPAASAEAVTERTITGRVLYRPGGKAVGGVDVALWHSGDGAKRAARTDSRGVYSFKVQPSQHDYVIRVASLPAGVWVEGVAIRVDRYDVRADDLCLRRPQSLSGTVRDERGQPVASAGINFSTADAAKNRDGIVTDEKGKYCLYVLPRSVSLYCDGTRDRYYPDREQPRKIREVAADQNVTGVDFTVRSAPTITGEVFLPDGRPAKGVQVNVVAYWSGNDRRASDADGSGVGWTFRLRSDERGQFTGYLRRPFQRDWKETITLKAIARLPDHRLGGEVRAETQTGVAAPHLKLTLAACASATARVVAADGKVIENPKLTASDIQPGFNIAYTGAVERLADGRYRMTGLIPGLDYYLQATAPAYRSGDRSWKEFQLAPGQDYDAGILVLQRWTKDDIPDLVRMLQSGSTDRIRTAEQELVALGKDAQIAVVDVLQTNGSKCHRLAAIRILARIGSSFAVEALDAIKTDADAELRQAAAIAVKTIQERAPSPAPKAAASIVVPVATLRAAQGEPAAAEASIQSAPRTEVAPTTEAERAIARLVLVYMEDRLRRAVPAVLVDAGNRTLIVTAGPAGLIPDGVPPAIDRSFLEFPKRATVNARYMPDSTTELSVYAAEPGLTGYRPDDKVTLAVGDVLSAIIPGSSPELSVTPRAVRVAALDCQAALSLPQPLAKVHLYEHLVEVDRLLPEGTPLFKDGKLAGLTLAGKRFLGETSDKSYVVPVDRIAALCSRFKAGKVP